ncbi:MAG: hypothetical protein LBH43_19530 [Treponema sp.]|nr:hypothetical protein [Treponema sp.]
MFFFFVFYFLPNWTLFPLPPQKVLHPGDWAYDALAILSREQGKIFFADSRITVAQMQLYLAKLNTDSLSESALVIYDRLAAYLKSGPWLGFQSDALSGGLDLILQPEFYFKTNENTPWVYGSHSREAVVQAPISFSLGPWITAEMDLYLGQNEYAATLHNNYVNIPLDPVPQTDIHFPKRAYVSAGLPVGEASGFNFTMGIGDNFFGKTRTGSIIISEYLERTIYAQATVYSPLLKYTTQVLQYEVNKYHYMHYLQVRPHRFFSISLAEGVMVNAPLELRFLNPFTIFHSYESYKTYANYNEDQGHKPNEAGLEELWDKNPDGTDKYDRTFDPNNHSRIGSYFGVKLEFQPLRYLRFYGLFVMDQFNLPMKKTNWLDTLYPDAAAFQAGAEFSFPGAGGYWEFGLEGVYTYPYMYVMWDKSWSFYKEVPELDIATLRYWTGSPFGPDTIAGTFWAGFRSSSLWYAGFSFEISACGERSELSIFDRDNSIDDTYRPHHKVYDVTVSPTGIPVISYTTTLRLEYCPREWLSFAFHPGYRVAANSGHEEGRLEQGFELAISARLKFPVNN